ncbi:hypothetical protein CHUAL_008598 [Chamberlinius hualienensis]
MKFLIIVVAVILTVALVECGPNDGKCQPSAKLMEYFINAMIAQEERGETPDKIAIVKSLSDDLEWINSDGEIDKEKILSSASEFASDKCMIEKLRSGFSACFMESVCGVTQSNEAIVACCLGVQHSLCEKPNQPETVTTCSYKPSCARPAMKLLGRIEKIKSNDSCTDGQKFDAIGIAAVDYFKEEESVNENGFLDCEKLKEFYSKCIDFKDESLKPAYLKKIDKCCSEGDITDDSTNIQAAFCALSIYPQVCEK